VDHASSISAPRVAVLHSASTTTAAGQLWDSASQGKQNRCSHRTSPAIQRAPLPSAVVVVLWVEKHQWRVCLRQQAQQRERIAALHDVHYERVIEHDALTVVGAAARGGRDC
jgi:hypothetical protein